MAQDLHIAGVFKGALAGGAAAGAVNVALYFAGAAAGAEYLMLQPGAETAEPVPFFMPFVMSVMPGLVAAIGLSVLLKITPAKAWTVFLVLLGLAFLVMLPGPVQQMGDDTVAMVMLEVMHVVTVVGVGLGIHKLGRR